jgi:hypothetical protein
MSLFMRILHLRFLITRKVGLAKANHRAESRKAFKEIYYYTIEFISETAEDYFQKWFVFSSIVNGASKLTVEKGRVFLLFQPS